MAAPVIFRSTASLMAVRQGRSGDLATLHPSALDGCNRGQLWSRALERFDAVEAQHQEAFEAWAAERP